MRPVHCALPLALAFSSVAASAQAEDAGRYTLGASRDGFVRLDTATGAVSHCTQAKGVWRCQPLPADTDRVGALATEVAALAAKVAALKARLDVGSTPVETVSVPALAGDKSESLSRPGPSLLTLAMDRFLDLVRTLKHGRDG
jgi:hypothetical protein